MSRDFLKTRLSEVIILMSLLVFLVIVWSYNIDKRSRLREERILSEIINVRSSFNQEFFQLDRQTQGRWSLEMMEEYNKELIDHIADPEKNPPPKIPEIKQEIQPNLP